jgi:type II secretory pathway pseudopilin PulG
MYIMVTMAASSLDRAIEKTVECQTQVDQSLISCALERYRLAHGAYPSSLDALVLEYLTKIPNSPIDGKPMNYSVKPDGSFLLWTPSWNLQSLDGKPGQFIGEGDIVWGQPIPKLPKELPKK